MRVLLLLPLLVLGASPLQASQSEDRVLRVEVLALLSPNLVKVASRAPIDLPDSQVVQPGTPLSIALDGGRLAVAIHRGVPRFVDSLTISARGKPMRLDVSGRESRQRIVHGTVTFSVSGGAVRIVATSALEDLVASAVSAELAHFDDAAALEAAAIALRSFYAAGPRHTSEGFDFCDSTHCAHSRGDVDPSTPHDRGAAQAARATSGLVMTFDGRILAGYCTACCGGRTATPGEVWGSAATGGYRSVPCEWCARSAYYRWRRTMSMAKAGKVASVLAGRPLRYIDLRITRSDNGIVAAMALRSGTGETTVTGDAFRMAVGRAIGWDALPSPRFRLDRGRSDYAISGSGFGHCIGLCLEGAVTLARRGATGVAILRLYYPDARIEWLPGVRTHV